MSIHHIREILSNTFGRKLVPLEEQEPEDDVSDDDVDTDLDNEDMDSMDDNSDLDDGDLDSEDLDDGDFEGSETDLDGDGIGGSNFGGSGGKPKKNKESKDKGEDEKVEPEKAADVDITVDKSIPDQQKVELLFSDTGDFEKDYSVKSESNIRLAKFKFQKAGIDISPLYTPEELDYGLPVDEIEDRMSPEQREQYKKSNVELRKKFPKLGMRERNVIIYNSDVPILIVDETGNEIEANDDTKHKAYKKIDDYMEKRFGDHWQDKRRAVEYLSEIKVVFGAKNSIRPNLVSADVFRPTNDDEYYKIPFNKVRVSLPTSIDEFVRSNLYNVDFTKSSIFRSLSSSYLDTSAQSNSVYAIILPELDNNDFDNSEEEIGDMNDEEPENLEGEDEEGIEI